MIELLAQKATEQVLRQSTPNLALAASPNYADSSPQLQESPCSSRFWP